VSVAVDREFSVIIGEMFHLYLRENKPKLSYLVL
jgi:hypothetical protein